MCCSPSPALRERMATPGSQSGGGGGGASRGLSKENADVLGDEHVLVEGYLAAADEQPAADPAQSIAPRPDVKILLGLRAAAVDDEIGMHLELGGCVAGGDLDIGNQVTGAGRRILRPGHAGLQSCDATLQCLFGLVQYG